MADEMEDKLVLRMRRMLGEWLAREDWEPRQLIDWLQGYDLPPVGHDEEPYLWLLRGLPIANERHQAETRLACRVAKVLEGKPDKSSPGTRPDEVLYNLFMLAAGLGCPHQLTNPLYEIFERGVLKGKWLGVDLRQALQAALILNQLDNRLQPVWESMVERGEHDFLPGNEYDGLEGLRLMPESEATLGEPALDAIGKALRNMASHLNQEPDRRQQFRSLIAKVLETYPGRPSWNIDLVQQADKYQWPVWAVECLPSLYIPLKDQLCESDRAMVWHYILACVPESHKYEVITELCEGYVLDVKMSEEVSNFVQFIAPVFEQARLNNPYSSDRSVIAVVAGAMSQVELLATIQDAHEAITAIRQARRRILGRAGVEPDLDALGEAIQKIAEWCESERNREYRARILIKAAIQIYPMLDLKRQAKERRWPSSAVALLKKVA